MDTEAIIRELEAERDRLNEAIAVLGHSRRRPGRPTGLQNGRERSLSAAARKRISDAMKKRWAAKKRAV